MKKSAIIQMYHGESGQEDLIKPSKKFFELTNKVVEYEDELRSKVSEELYEFYKKLSNTIIEMNSCLLETHYAQGFKFGCLIGMEIMSND